MSSATRQKNNRRIIGKSRSNLAKYCYIYFLNAANTLLILNKANRLTEYGNVTHAWLRNHFKGIICRILIFQHYINVFFQITSPSKIKRRQSKRKIQRSDINQKQNRINKNLAFFRERKFYHASKNKELNTNDGINSNDDMNTSQVLQSAIMIIFL